MAVLGRRGTQAAPAPLPRAGRRFRDWVTTDLGAGQDQNGYLTFADDGSLVSTAKASRSSSSATRSS